MEWLLALLGVVLVVAIVGVLRGRRDRQGAPARPVDALADDPGGSLDDLGVGALVRHRRSEWLVRGAVRFDADGHVRSAYHLDEADGRWWLTVDAREADVAVWQAVDQDLGLDPTASTELRALGETWIRVVHGHASFTSTGTTGLPASGHAEHAEFRNAKERGRLLGFERRDAGGTWEVSRGRRLVAEELRVTPGGRAAGGDA